MENSVRFFQVKIIRKGTKPPVWRRAYVPAGITFSQLACILETMMELPYSDRYEFEFFQRKDRLIEWHEEDEGVHDYSFRYLNAPDTFVNERLLHEKWFTFRIRKAFDQPQYRVEIEKAIDSIGLTVDGHTEKLNCPMLIKEISCRNESAWTDGNVINTELKNKYFLYPAEPEYLYLAEVRDLLEKGKGIGVCKEMEDRHIHDRKSTRDMFGEIADLVGKAYVEEVKNKLAEVPGYNKETGEISIESEEDEEKLRGLLKQTEAELEELQEQMKEKFRLEFPKHTQDGTSRSPSVEELLKEYTAKDLKEIAEDIGCPVTAKQKNRLAYEIARFLLTPDTMRSLFLEMDEEQLDTWESAMGKGCYLPTEEEYEQLDPFINLNYMAEYMDDRVEIPEESKTVYGILQKTGYRSFHEEARWLLTCLRAFDMILVIAPEKILYRMFQRKSGIKTTYTDFENLLKKLPDRLHPCVVKNGKVMSRVLLKENLYRRIEDRQRDVECYIPTEEEIISYGSHSYPDCEKSYVRFWEFLHKKMKLTEMMCDDLCMEAFRTLTTGGLLSDYMDILNEEEIVFESDAQVNEFAQLFMTLNNHTRMFELRGHTPLEVRSLLEKPLQGKKPAIVPMSSMAADLLREGSEQISKAGFILDLDSGADEIPMIGFPNGMNGQPVRAVKKVYPNDPCPCGNGKKYKKCCGRK